MKKVWVLEKWIDRKRIEDMYNEYVELFNDEKSNRISDEDKTKVLTKLKERLSDPNMNGYWLGYEGKSNYKDFCSVASDFIRRHKNENYKLRVVSAYIDDDAEYWVGYKNPTENEGVLRYLFVKARY